MGKRYHCEYCDKTMVATPAIVKTHNKGIVHQKLVQEHYQQFKGILHALMNVDKLPAVRKEPLEKNGQKTWRDPEIILAEETVKKRCARFVRGDCQFGSICRYSHYSQEQIQMLNEIVASRKQKEINDFQPSLEDLYIKLQSEKSSKPNESDSSIICDKNGLTHVLPWTYNEIFYNYGMLPPSVKQVKLEEFYSSDVNEWG